MLAQNFVEDRDKLTGGSVLPKGGIVSQASGRQNTLLRTSYRRKEGEGSRCCTNKSPGLPHAMSTSSCREKVVCENFIGLKLYVGNHVHF